ncbi:MAG: flippase-like domain-containing protein [Clostridia bacterium]|nr:flippase-like domain-containing protein [Clostridia bacterium]
MKQSKWSRIFNAAVIVLSVAVVGWILLSTDDLTRVGEALTHLHPGWLAAAFLSYGGYLLCEGLGLMALLRPHGYRMRAAEAVHLSLIGVFYGYITPGYSGGQPMQVYHMVRRKIDAGVSLSCVAARHFFNHLTITGMTLLLWAANAAYAASQVGHLTALIVIGLVMTFANVPITLAVVLNRPLVERLVMWFIRLMERWRICRHPDRWQEKAVHTMDECQQALAALARSPGQVLLQLVISSVQGLCLMAAPCLVYKALGLTGTAWHHVLTISFLLFVSASYAPLPGATGAQEGGFVVFFAGIFGENAPVGLLIWRFVTFYLCLLIGCADTVFISSREPKPCQRQAREESL